MPETDHAQTVAEALRRYSLFLGSKTDKQRAHNYTRLRKYLTLKLNVPEHRLYEVEQKLHDCRYVLEDHLSA